MRRPACPLRADAAASLLLAATVFHLAAPPAVLGQPELKVVGTWGGAVNTVFVDPAEPDIAYIGSGRRLVILNVADPANIIELGSLDLGNLVLDLKARNGYAYVGTFSAPNHFCIVDVSNRSNPSVVWHSNRGRSRQVEIFGDWVYVRRGSHDLEVYDVRTPTNPRRWVALENVYALTIVGELMYVGWDEFPPDVAIFDLSTDPTKPTLLGRVTLPIDPLAGQPTDIAVDGRYACVTVEGGGFDGGLGVVDVSEPSAPVVVSTYSDFFRANSVATAAGHAFVADWVDSASPPEWERTKGLAVIDVATDPADPKLVATFKTHGTIAHVDIFGDRAYVSDDGEGMIILDISDPPRPLRLGNWHSPTELRKIAKVGDLLYLTDQWNAVTILSVADPSRPVLVGVYQSIELGLGIDHWGIAGRGDFVYLAAGWNGFEVIDVSTPGEPRLAGAVRMVGNDLETVPLAVSQDGDVAHVGIRASDGVFLRNYDIGNPEAPSTLATVAVTGNVLDFAARADGIVFVAEQNGVGAVETSDPEHPIYLGRSSVASQALAVDNDLLYVANPRSLQFDGGLYIQDVSDPANQVTLGHFPGFAQTTAVAVRDRVAYVLGPFTNGAGHGLQLVDVSDPAAPALLTETPVPGAHFDVLVDGRRLRHGRRAGDKPHDREAQRRTGAGRPEPRRFGRSDRCRTVYHRAA